MLRLFSISGEGKDKIFDLLCSYFDEEPEAVSPGCDLGYSIGKFLVLKNRFLFCGEMDSKVFDDVFDIFNKAGIVLKEEKLYATCPEEELKDFEIDCYCGEGEPDPEVMRMLGIISDDEV